MRSRITVAISDSLGLILGHEVDSGVQFYQSDTFQQIKTGDFEAKTHRLSLPLGFIPGSRFAVLGNRGMGTVRSQSIF